jgi:hypothetical protein
MIVVKIGGCNGSGKSSIVREVIKQKHCTPEPDALGPTIYRGNGNIVVLGKYETSLGTTLAGPSVLVFEEFYLYSRPKIRTTRPLYRSGFKSFNLAEHLEIHL